MGDFNMPPTHKFIAKLKAFFYLTDVVDAKGKEDDRLKSTYKWEKQRIDHVLCSNTLLEQIDDVIVGDYESLSSDHRPIRFSIRCEQDTIKTPKARTIQQWQHKKGLKLRQKAWNSAHNSGIFKFFGEIKRLREENTKLSKRKIRHLRFKDKMLTKIIKKGAKTGRVPINQEWSPEIKLQWKRVKLYIMWRSHHKRSYQDDDDKIKELAEELQIDYNQTTDFFTLQKTYNKEVRKMRQLRENAKKLRDNFFDQRTKAAMLTMKGSYETILKAIRRHEEKKQDNAEINRTLKPRRRQHINHIEVPTEQGWTDLHDIEEIEKIMRNEADRHFGQASDTPVVQNGTAATLERIILEENPKDWEKKLRAISDEWSPAKNISIPSSISPTITSQEVISGFRHWREQTTTSPSGRNLSLYKILTQKKFGRRRQKHTERL